MKILIWTQHFWPEIFRINEITKALKNHGHDVSVLTGKPNYPEGDIYKGYSSSGTSRELFDEIEVFRVPIVPRKKGSALNLILNYLSFIFSSFTFAPFLLRKKSFDTIFVYATSPLLQALSAIFLAWFKSAELVIWVQDLWPESLEETGFVKNRFLLWIVKNIVRYIYSKADLILIQSEGFGQPVSKLVKDDSKIKILYNPADSMDNLAMPEHSIVDKIKQKFSVVFTGNIGSVQSCETIIEAASIIKNYSDIEFYLVGDGSRYQAISALIKEKKLVNVIMTGKLEHKYMQNILANASCLLISLKNLSSISRTIPSKLPSYFAAGRPVIASINGEVASIINKANAGLVTDAENAQALADSIIKLYQMSSVDRLKLGNNAKNYYESNFHIDMFLQKITDYLQTK